MNRYQFLEKGFFESFKKFEQRLNVEYDRGWRVKSMSHRHSQLVVLLEIER